jgi:hypothetical protein
MARFAYTVKHLPFGADTTIDNVQSLTVNRGRTQVQDPFKAGTATITGRVPSSLPTLKIGDDIRINCVGSAPSPDTFNGGVFSGKIADFEINYGIVAAEDTWTIYAEDTLAEAGRALTSDTYSWSAGIAPNEAAFLAAQNAGLFLFRIGGTPPDASTVSAQTLNNANLLNLLNQLAFTAQAFLYSTAASGALYWRDRATFNAIDYGAFTDGTLSIGLSFPILYDNLKFFSQADSFFTQVVVTADGLAPQVSSGSNDRSVNYQSYNETTTQAQNLADYVLATLQVQDAVPESISCISETQTNDTMMRTFTLAGTGERAEIVLRGERYYVYLNGATLSASPEQTRITYNLVSSDALSFFILDDAFSGVLDQNKLGF